MPTPLQYDNPILIVVLGITYAWLMVQCVGSLWSLVITTCQDGAFEELGWFISIKLKGIVVNESLG